MKKILQAIYSYKNIEVTDADTGKKEIAQYQMILGVPFRIKYSRIHSISTLKASSKEIEDVLLNSALKAAGLRN